MKIIQYFILFQLLYLPSLVAAQVLEESSETGLPFSTEYYSGDDYHAYHQNWSIVEDQRGILFVANRNGILEYDGTTWKLIRTASNTTVRSLALGSDNLIYAGLQGDLGFLKSDGQGTLHFVSLLDKVDEQNRQFADVWGTHATPNGTYFQTSKQIFRWNGQTMQCWESEQGFHTSFVANDKFYVREKGEGLKVFQNEELLLVDEGAFFADKKIYTILPYPDEGLLIATSDDGLFIHDGVSVVPLHTQADSLFSRYMLYHGTALRNNLFAFATLGGGVIILDSKGELVQVLNQSSGLPDDVITYTYLDRQGNLWLTLNNKGLIRVDILAPSRFDNELGLRGTIRDIIRHNKTLYVATGNGEGLYTFTSEASPNKVSSWAQPSFVSLPGVPNSWKLASMNDNLLVATEVGVFLVKEGAIHKLTDTQAFVFKQSDYHHGVVYVGRKDGLSVLRLQASGQILESRVQGIEEEIRIIVEENANTLWLATRHQGVLRLQIGNSVDAPTEIQLFGDNEGLPESRVNLTNLGHQTLFFSDHSIVRYHASPHVPSSRGRFYPDTTLMSLLSLPEDSVLSVSEGPNGSLWVVFKDHVKVVRQNEKGDYLVEVPEALRFPKGTESFIYPEEDGIVWHSKGDVLYRYDPRMQLPKNPPFSVWIRTVHGLETDTLIFGGAFKSEKGNVSLTQGAAYVPALAYADKNLTFSYSAISRNDSNENTYQYKLDGLDQQWSAWTPSTSKSYTNLQEGTYQFIVHARDVNGDISTEAAYAFVILPPWYRTWWAYSLYGLFLVSLITFAEKYRRMVLAQRLAAQQAQELARERLVNKRLQVANERLQQANKLKDEFLATTSHELRTPLTAILGYTAVVKEEVAEETGLCEFLEIIEENGNRLMQTLNSLLELAKLRAGTLELYPKPIELAQHAAEVVSKLSRAAGRKNLFLELIPPQVPLYANLDFQALEKVLINLVNNAIKFTETGGITLHCAAEGKQVKIHVQDTGIGIDARFLPELFVEFKQESDGPARSYEGSGLGLAITAQLVRLMKGEIAVESEKGRGSVFTLSFPAYSNPVDAPPRPPLANGDRSRISWQSTT